MFIIRLFTGSIIGMITGLFVGIMVLVLLLAGLLVGLAATGGPGSCTPGGGPTTIDAANAAGFQTKWDAMNVALDGGAPASASFNESELSSRADKFLREKDAPLKNPRVCLHNGYGEGSGKFSFLGFNVKFKVKGTMELAGTHPKAKIDSIEIGNVPGFLIAPAERFVNSAIDNAMNDVSLGHKYTPALTEGKAAVGGQP